MQQIRVLRPTRQTGLISARFFSEHFARNLAPYVNIHEVQLTEWFSSVFGPQRSKEDIADRLLKATAGYDFFCPSYEGFALTPLFLYYRNLCRAAIRLMFIAHAPGQYSLEWLLLRPLLRPGDLIIAPSRSARETIEFLCPELSPFISVIPHPIHPLRTARKIRRSKIVSLSRISPDKLIHRQIEAMSILKKRGVNIPKMEIAGPLVDDATGQMHTYARSIRQLIKRLGLSGTVKLRGAIYGDEKKARFLAGARLLVYLSVCVEEAFPKSTVEALSMGVPVVSTLWDGFQETVGACGRLVEVYAASTRSTDVDPSRVADAIEAALDNPPAADACRSQAEKFAPDRIGRLYREALESALQKGPSAKSPIMPGKELSAAPRDGLLHIIAPLQEFSWHDIFNLHIEDCDITLRAWAGETLDRTTYGQLLRGLVLEGTRVPLERFLGRLDYKPDILLTDRDSNKSSAKGDFHTKIVSSVTSDCMLRSRLVCLAALLSEEDQREQFIKVISALKDTDMSSPAMAYLIIEGELLIGNYSGAFKLCLGTGEWAEYDHHTVRQLARICRIWGRPERAVPYIKTWLGRFPDSVNSAAVWVDLCVNAMQSGRGFRRDAREAFKQASRLLGEIPLLEKIKSNLSL